MTEQNTIDDVRGAKRWLDAQAPNVTELGAHLGPIEQAYRSRTGIYAELPSKRSEAVQKAVDNAQDEPGHALLNETRPG